VKSLKIYSRNGCEWWKLRSELQKGLSSVQNVRNFLPYADQVTLEFFQQLDRRMPNNGVMTDMLPEVSRLNLECEL
jgi:ecdysteroid 25-hydroxylase CYP302A1